MQKLAVSAESLALHRAMNHTQTAYPDTQSVAELYEAAAERWPRAQAVVQGDGKPALEAVLWPAHAAIADEALATAVERANAALPDYARVRRFVRARVPFTPQAGACTPNGRPQRRAIEAMHADAFATDSSAFDPVRHA